MDRNTLTVTREVRLDAPANEVWNLIGDFYRLDRWHPGVAECRRADIEEDEFRIIATKDGGRLLEHLEHKTTHSYTYTIVRSPLPVRHYESLLEVTTAGDGCAVTWSGSFTPTSDKAEKAVAGIYEAGLKALEERFGKGGAPETGRAPLPG